MFTVGANGQSPYFRSAEPLPPAVQSGTCTPETDISVPVMFIVML